MPSVFKKSVVRYLDPEGRQVKKGTPGARKVREKSAKWYGRPPGATKPVPLCENKTAAQIMLNDLTRKAELGRAGIADPFEAHHKRPLAEHLDDFEASVLAKGGTAKQAKQVAARARKVIDGCGFVFTADLSASRVMEYLAGLRRDGRPLPPLEPGKETYKKTELAAALALGPAAAVALVRRHRLDATGEGKARRFPRATVEALRDRLARGRSVQTSNFYLQAVKQFCRWLVKDRRTGDNPLAHLEGGNVRTDRRHDRRELEADELRRLLDVTRASGRTFRGLTGPDRFHLYAAACATGFRAAGLASLTPESFDLDGDMPTVTLSARDNKNRRQKIQPLPPDVAALLRDYLAGKPAGVPVWGGTGTWAQDYKGAEMLRIDLDAAGIPYEVEGPDGPLFADFHALRHTYLTLGGRAGIDLRTLQELAGHSTPALTARYSHRRIYDLAGAVEKLPNFLPAEGNGGEAQTLPATGTEGGRGPAPCPNASVTVNPSCSPVAQTADGGCVRVMTVEKASEGRPKKASGANSLQDRRLRPADGDCGRLRGVHLAGLEPATFGSVDRCDGDAPTDPDSTSGESTIPVARQLHNPAETPAAGPADPDLARVCAAWPELPPHIKAAVLALVDTAGKRSEKTLPEGS